ncbi:MAG: CPBP family intramembrane metalloprotease [Caulobacteraceae bacterium]|nr:CPBP family intramembrane metalloprotease [Caulobacteraceae bacterium]
MTSKTLFSAEAHRGWLPWGLLSPFLCIAFVAMSLLGTSPWLKSLGLEDSSGDPIGLTGVYAFLLIPFAALGLLIVAWVRLVERRPLSTVGLTGPAPARTLFGGILIGAVMIMGLIAAVGGLGGYEVAGPGRALASPRVMGSIGLLLLCFVVQAGVEELLFRGWLLSAVTRKLGLPIGVLLTSLVFTFLHWSPNQYWLITVSSFAFSAFACAWAIRARNIWGVMGWHIGWNWLLSIGFGLPVTGLMIDLPPLLVHLVPQGPDSLTGGAEGPEGSWVCSLLFMIGIAVLLLRPRKS